MSLFRSSGADATWRSYERFWREWHNLVSGLGVGASAEDRLHVLPRFLGRSCENGVSVASLNVKMAGLAILFQFNGVEEVTKGVCGTQGFAGLAKRSGQILGGRCCSICWKCWWACCLVCVLRSLG